MLTTHPAPSTYRQGLAIFVPAVWTIPENPIKQAMEGARLGDIVSGLYSLPENPIVAEILAKQKLLEEASKEPPVGLSQCGIGGCPCQIGLCGGLGGGLGLSVDEVLKNVTSGGWQTWAVAGVGILALVLLTGGGGSQRRSEISAAKAEYRAKVARIKAERPRRYQKFV
jgi:hypothetical protein